MIELGKHYLSNTAYHADKDYLSSSVVKLALFGVMAFKSYMDNLGKSEKKSTAALDFGTLVHTIVLEPKEFDNEYVIYDGETTETGLIPAKVRKEQALLHPTKTVVTKAAYNLACKIRKNCELDPKVFDLLFKDEGENEVSYFTICDHSGFRVKVRLDRGILTRAIIVDLKTAEKIDQYSFQKEVKFNRHYDLSAYMYVMQVLKATGVLCDFYWVVAGKDELAQIAVYKASAQTLLDGQEKYFRAMANIKRAKELKKGEVVFYQDQIEEM